MKNKKIDEILLKNGIEVNYQNAGQGTFTKEHTIFNCSIKDNNKNIYTFTYECNLKYTKPTNYRLLACVINDSDCYISSIVSDDDLDNLNEFSLNFGYDNIKDCIKAFNECKKAHTELHKIFTDEELETLYNEFCEMGEI